MEPWNPFDTSGKTCFPNVYEALSPNCTTAAVQDSDVVDIDHLARYSPVNIDDSNPPELGNLPLELTRLLEAKCQAWFDEQQRFKAARGDSPTPSCNFKLPGIPFRDTLQEESADADPTAAVTGSCAADQLANASRDTPAATTATSVACVGNEAAQQIQQSRLQGEALRQSFAFYSPSRQMAASPTYPFTAPGQGNSAAVQQRLPTRDDSAAESGATEPSTAAAGAVVAALDGSAGTRLSWIMQQNMQQLQLILQDQPQQQPVPPGQQPQQQAAQHQLSWASGPQQHQQQQHEQVHSLQYRLSMLLQQNQQQLQQLLEQHKQQVHEQHQHQWVQLKHELGQQEQQQQHHHQGLSDEPLEQAHHPQTQQGLLQLQLAGDQQQHHKTEQRAQSASLGTPSPSVALSSSRYLPGSPERASAAAAAAVAAANRARQRLADSAAGGASESPPRSPERVAAAAVSAAIRARYRLADSFAAGATGSPPGSPERAAVAVAAAVAAANRARQRVADVAAAGSPPRRVPVVVPAELPGSPAAADIRQLYQSNAAELVAAASARPAAAAPTAARSREVSSVAAAKQLQYLPAAGGSSSGAVYRHVAPGVSTSPAAAPKLSWTTAVRAQVSSTKDSRPHGLLPSQIAAEDAAAAAVPRLPFLHHSAAAATPRLSWQGLQALQQQRWQQRLKMLGASAADIAAAADSTTRSPVRNAGTQTESPPKDEAVQTDSPPPAAAAAGTATQRPAAAGGGPVSGQAAQAGTTARTPFGIGGIPAVTEVLAASGWGVSASPAAAGARLQAVSPIAVAAAVAAAAAAAAMSAVAAAVSPTAAAAAQSTARTGSQSPVCSATVSAAVAAAVAATAAATAVASPVYQQQQQQQAMSSTPATAAAVTLPAVTTGHVVRSLFPPSHPTTPAAGTGAAMRPANISSSVRLATAAESLNKMTATAARTRVTPRVGSAGTRMSQDQQEQLHSGPSTWRREQLQQQRPLPWPVLPGVEKQFLSPMKAYQDSSRLGSSSSNRRRRIGQQPGDDQGLRVHQLEALTAAVADSSERVPLGDTTNSHGAASTVSSQHVSPTHRPVAAVEAPRLSRSPRRLADLVASRAAAGGGGVDAGSNVAGVITGLSDSAIMQAFIPAAAARPAAAAARTAAHIVSYGSPALQRLWSEYKAASTSVPNSPAVWYKQQLPSAAATLAADLARSSTAVMQPKSPTAAATKETLATVDRPILQQGRQAGTSPPKSAELVATSAAVESARLGASSSCILAPVNAGSSAAQAGAKQQQQHQQSATTQAVGTLPGSQPTGGQPTAQLTPFASPAAAGAAAMLTMVGPAAIPSRFYPPSARKLLGDSSHYLTTHSMEVRRAFTLAAAAGGSAGVAEVAQQQLRLLLEQQLASMALARRPLATSAAPTTAAAVARQPCTMNQGLFLSSAVTAGAAVAAAAAAGHSTDQQGHEGDVDTDSSIYYDSDTASPSAHKDLHNREQNRSHSSSTIGSLDRRSAGQQGGAVEAVEQLDVQQGRAGAEAVVGSGVGGSSSNRIARLVAAYQQQQAGRSHPMQQPVTGILGAQLTHGPGGGQISGDLIHQASAAPTDVRLSARESTIEGTGAAAAAHMHALPRGRGDSADLPEMLQRYLQD